MSAGCGGKQITILTGSRGMAGIRASEMAESGLSQGMFPFQNCNIYDMRLNNNTVGFH